MEKEKGKKIKEAHISIREEGNEIVICCMFCPLIICCGLALHLAKVYSFG